MNLPNAPATYSAADQGDLRSQIIQADKGNRKTTNDVDMKGCRLYLYSPNGDRWQVTVSNAGAFSAVAD